MTDMKYLVAIQDELGQWIPEYVGWQEPCSLDEAQKTVAELRKHPYFIDVTLAIVEADDTIRSGNDVTELHESEGGQR